VGLGAVKDTTRFFKDPIGLYPLLLMSPLGKETLGSNESCLKKLGLSFVLFTQARP